MGAQIRSDLLVEAVDSEGTVVAQAAREAPGRTWVVTTCGPAGRKVLEIAGGTPEVMSRRLVLAVLNSLAGEGPK